MVGRIGAFDARLQELLGQGLNYREAVRKVTEEVAVRAWVARTCRSVRALRFRSRPIATAPVPAELAPRPTESGGAS
jgi:hypothetical protein